MDTNKLKKFAAEARVKLKEGVKAKIIALGFDGNGNVSESNRPVPAQGGCVWTGKIMSETFLKQWNSLYNRIQSKGLHEVYEEAAYTWFNRLVAIRILQKNNLCSSVLDFVDEARTPSIVFEARSGILPQMDDETRREIMELLDDDTKTTEQFAMLITAWCRQNPIIANCFGSIADYTELLLPNNILSEGGYIDMLNHTEFISEEDWKTTELIGWLYQFYISERKDEVFASFKKGKKAEAEDIPAATQIFTPNWIVKYMVQNTIGRIYLDNNPRCTLRENWKYLIEPSEPTPADCILKFSELTELKFGDLACGSGHIVNEGFDIFYDLYIHEGYSRREAIKNIFTYNLTGIDLDTRAKQLAMFSLMLKACQKDNSFVDGHCLPRVLTMPHCNRYTWRDLNGHMKTALHPQTQPDYEEIDAAFELLEQAENLGSVMKFDISENTRQYLQECCELWKRNRVFEDAFSELFAGFELILALTEKYSALCENPPYMGAGNMNSILGQYVKDNYPDTKADLFSVFMDFGMESLIPNGKMAHINMQSWMFLSSFETMRKRFLRNYHIDNMLHLGSRTFDELSGEVVQNTSFVMTKNNSNHNWSGGYFRLVEGKKCDEKENLYIDALRNLTYYLLVKQNNFEKISGSPIAYWVSKKQFDIFENYPKLSKELTTREGMAPADNQRFLKLWFEIDIDKTTLGNHGGEKWFPYIKGGEHRKWSGNFEFLVNWENDGYAIKHNIDERTGRIRSHNYNGEYSFRESISWTVISFGKVALRYTMPGCLWDSAGASGFAEKNLFYHLALTNSVVGKLFLAVLSPSTKLNVGELVNIPLIERSVDVIEGIARNNVSVSKQDWDAHETSWDFAQNELLAINEDAHWNILNDYCNFHNVCVDAAPFNEKSLEDRVNSYKMKWDTKFHQLHSNEEELNRQFIEIYGLQDELTPEVPLDEVTILQQGEISIENDDIVWHDDVLMKQFISYAVGTWFGRYRLDKPGLHIAHPNPTEEELAPYQYNGQTIEFDDDGIFPLMTNDSGFSDNASLRFADFIREVFGADMQAINLNFIEKCLGKSLEQYFVKDFWKDHKKMYQNRPIYWLFSSKKGAFQCLVYMHRMNPYTCERVRAKYLLPYIENLQSKINDLEQNESALSTTERRLLDKLRTQIEECKEYQERLQMVAEQQIGFDLDDGVIVNYAKFGDVLAKIK